MRLPVQPAEASRVAVAPRLPATGVFRWHPSHARTATVDAGRLALRHAAGNPARPRHSRPATPGAELPALAPATGAPVDPALSPVAFAHAVLGVRLWDKQEEVLTALTEHRRVAVKAGNGLGKGFCAAVAVLWFMHTHPDSAIALSTAPTFRQVRHILWRQIHRLYRPAADTLGGKMMDTRWELPNNRFAMGLSADSADQFQGFHSPNMLIVVDEAEGVNEEIYEAIESLMTSDNPLLLLIGNPTSTSGAFHRAFYEERMLYRNITISALESPNVRAGHIVMPGLATADWVEERKQVWGADSSSYRSRVLGLFSDQGAKTLINKRHIWNAVNRKLPQTSGREEVVFGVDVARFGEDRTVILRRRGNTVEDIQVMRNMDTMEVAECVQDAIRDHHPAHVHVDEIGWGAGVVDRLKQLGCPVRGINVAQASRLPQRFSNLRSEGYWALAHLFVSGGISIPDDSELISELSNILQSEDLSGRNRIERKDDILKRGLPSPDKADALMLAFLPPAGKVNFWF